MNISDNQPIVKLLQCRADAEAVMSGSSKYPEISGGVRLYQVNEGVVVFAKITGLPASHKPCGGRFFGFHIHGGASCGGSIDDPFTNSMSHYDTGNCPHPFHAGDLPPLLGDRGCALSIFFTSRFTVNEIIGKTIIIHDKPDDYRSQPSGNAGEKIACGIIKAAE